MRREAYTKDELEDIIHKYSKSLVRLAFTYAKNIQDAEDIVQDVFIKLMTKAPWFENEEHERAWMIRVTINTSINYVKALGRRKQTILSEDIPSMPKEKQEVLEYVMQLPDKYKSVIYLYYYEGYDTGEISQVLGKSVSTICTWLQRGRNKLEVNLRKEGVSWMN